MNLKEHKKSNVLIVAYLREISTIESLNEFLYSVAMQKHTTDLLLLHEKLTEAQQELLQQAIDKPTINLHKPNPDFDPENPSKAPEVISEPAQSVFPLNVVLHETKLENFAEIFNTGFQAAQDAGYEFLSFSEPEDVYSTYWIDNALVYAKEKSDIGIFTPIIRNVVFGAFQGYYNEAPWAEGMAEEAGKYDQNLLLKFNCLSILGAVIRMEALTESEDAIEIGDDDKLYPMKRNIKLTSPYEFYLRMVYNDIEIMNVPRLGYEQRIFKRDAYYPTTSKLPQNLVQLPVEKGGMTQEEAQFWHKKATDAYFIEDDEPIEFIPA